MTIRFFAVALLLAATSYCLAQSSDLAKPAQSEAQGQVVKGFSSYTNFQGSHDSSAGWSTIVNSSVRYDFNKIFGVELGVPFYMSHNGFNSDVVARGNSNPPLVTSYGSLGDAYLSLNFSAPGPVGYRATITGTAPTGDQSCPN